MSFLIVDDNLVMRRTVRHVVNDFASEIIECSDGAEAVAAYAKYHPDWVLMDIEMPNKDGFAATREICSAFPRAHIVLVTNYSDDAMRKTAIEAGACGFVQKGDLLDLHGIIDGKR